MYYPEISPSVVATESVRDLGGKHTALYPEGYFFHSSSETSTAAVILTWKMKAGPKLSVSFPVNVLQGTTPT